MSKMGLYVYVKELLATGQPDGLWIERGPEKLWPMYVHVLSSGATAI